MPVDNISQSKIFRPRSIKKQKAAVPPLIIFSYGTWEKRDDIASRRMVESFAKSCSLPAGNKFILDDINLLATNVDVKVAQILTAIKNEVLRRIKLGEPIPDKICGLGFSRGAVALKRIAYEYDHTLLPALIAERDQAKTEEEKNTLNQLISTLDNMRFFVFGNDPVAGPTHKKDKSATMISKRIKEYIATYQMHEKRWIMKGQGPSRTWLESPLETAISYLPLPGVHTDGVRMTVDKDFKVESSMISWILAHQFLTKHGVTFNDNKLPPLAAKNTKEKQKNKTFQIIDLAREFDRFSNPKEFLEHYMLLRHKDVSAETSKLRFGNDQPEDFVLDSDFFYNQHERELFKAAYPEVFNYLFENNCDQHSTQTIQAKLAEIKLDYPLTFHHIITKRGHAINDKQTDVVLANSNEGLIVEHEDNLFALVASGKNQIEDFRLRDAKPAGRSIVTLLERLVIDTTNRYKRECSEIKKNPDHAVAVQIREKAREIMSQPITDNHKAAEIMVLLKEQRKKLLAQSTSNALADKIDEIFVNFYQGISGLTNNLFKLPQQLNAVTKHKHILYKLFKGNRKPELANLTQALADFLAERAIDLQNYHSRFDDKEFKKLQPLNLRLQKRENIKHAATIAKFYQNIESIYEYLNEKITQLINDINKLCLNIEKSFNTGKIDTALLDNLRNTLLPSKSQLKLIVATMEQLVAIQDKIEHLPNTTRHAFTLLLAQASSAQKTRRSLALLNHAAKRIIKNR